MSTVRLEDFMEREAGCTHFRAVTLYTMQGNCEAAYEELRYDDDADAEVLAALKLLAEYEFTAEDVRSLPATHDSEEDSR